MVFDLLESLVYQQPQSFLEMKYYDPSSDAYYCCTCPGGACHAIASATLREEFKVLSNMVVPIFSSWKRTPEEATHLVKVFHNYGKLSIIFKASEFNASYRNFCDVVQAKLQEFEACKSPELKLESRQLLDDCMQISKTHEYLPCRLCTTRNA